MLVSACALPVLANDQPAPSAAPADESGRADLDQFAAAWARVNAYTATVTIFERNGTQVENTVLDYTFRKPLNVTVHVDVGRNAGVTMVWDGGATVTAHRGTGFTALFKRTISLHDPLATTIRGSSIDQLSFGEILAHGQQQAGSLTQRVEAQANGVDVDAVTLVSTDPTANAGLTREVVELSTSTHLPVEVLGYEGTTLVRDIGFSNVILEP